MTADPGARSSVAYSRTPLADGVVLALAVGRRWLCETVWRWGAVPRWGGAG
jgi:hypothetical protein